MSPAAPDPARYPEPGRPEPARRLVTVFGGSGFIGRYVVGALARRGWRVRVAVRQPHIAHHLQPLGTVGQIMPVQANVRYPDSLAAACSGADAVINLVAVLYSSGAQTFDAIHVEGSGAVAEAARDAGARRLIHMSALGADPDSPSAFARSKAEGEARALHAMPETAVVRPSVVFGPEDDFFNRFASMARLSPALPLIGGGHTKFQPVYAGDVAEGIARLLALPGVAGEAYEFGGPQVLSFREIMEYMLNVIQRRRMLVPIPWAIARLQAAVLQLLPSPPLTMDQVELLKSDNIVSEAAIRDGRTLEGLEIAPQAMEAIVPEYLVRFRRAGQFARQLER
ncbi:MAG TPA: complex I NDUFA9 subunit family protein [Aestuariivirgaceae bacterium]|nr:complex I NDUFA9 subunit family protein [Aestuariivirgaceae bacterium]